MTYPGTIDKALRDAAATLAAAGIPTADVDAEWLAAHALGVDRTELARRRALAGVLSVPEWATLENLVHDRARRVPLQHLTGKAHVRRTTVDVGPGVFVPRPETEVTIGHALDAVLACAVGPSAVTARHGTGTGRRVRVVDLCTGSGVIALAIAAEAAADGVDVHVVGVERSLEALAWAERNVERHGGGDRVEVRHGDVATCCDDCCDDLVGRCDVVVANPPYVPVDEEPRDPEARDHDPAAALYGGHDGLAVVRSVVAAAVRLLRDGGTLVVEHGDAQGPAVRDLAARAGLAEAKTHADLAGRPRVTVAVRPQ